MAAPPGSAAVGGQRGKLFGRRALMRCGSVRGGARPRDAVPTATPAPYLLPRDAAPAAASPSACLPFPRPRHFVGYAPSSHTAGLTVTAPFAAFLQPFALSPQPGESVR